jgi:uncharacterized protein with HEPN domain
MRLDRQRFHDILDARDSLARIVAGHTEASFQDSEPIRYAVVQRLTVVGEAAGRLSPKIRERYSGLPWADVIGFRNILVHEYFGIYWPFVWQTATEHAPQLREQIAEILHREFAQTGPD